MPTAHRSPADAADVNIEVRREAILLKAGALQNAILSSANFSSIATDAKGVIQIFNVGAERMLGYTAVDVVNTITPADISDPLEVIARAEALSVELGTHISPGFEALVFKASRGIEDIYELTYIRKDGSRFPAVVSVTALRDAQDAIIGYLLIGTDNTARKHAEEALLKAGALQNAIFNSANFSSIATDAKGVIQIFNVGAERMLGYTATEVVDKITPADISDPQEVILRAEALSVELGTPITPGFEALVFKASRGIEDIYELTYFRKDGSRFPAVVSVTALRDAQSAIIGYLLIGTDNTARKRLEQTFQEKNVELENANQAKDRFLASMSHELRTPLNAIIGFTGTLLMKLPGPLTTDQDSQLRTIQSSGRHLLSLINDLLDLAKIESGKVEVHFEQVSCTEVVAEIAATLRPLAETKGLAFEVEIPTRDIVVASDRRALSQIIINLTNNAIKFTDKGAVRLEVADRLRNGQASTEIRVVDTGAGIRPEDKAKLFQAFEQLEARSARRHEGTGLGLHLSQKLATLLGGHITFESELGHGSTFTVVLPRKAA
jgi:signal transduction histidine kinase